MKTYFSLLILILLLNFSVKAQLTFPEVTEINPEIQELIEQVSTTNLENNIRYLQNLGTRAAESPIALEAQNWLVEQFESYENLDVYVHNFDYDSPYNYNEDTFKAGNVIGVQKGTLFLTNIL